MNIHSLMLITYFMVKQTDLSKLYGVKEAAIKVIVERGYFGATIAQISKEAGVSDGYLYRHYHGKAELVRELYVERMGFFQTIIIESIRKNQSVKDVLVVAFEFLNEAVHENQNTIAFIFIMDHDHSFEFPDEIRVGFRTIGNEVQKMGLKTSEIHADRTIEEIIAIMFGLPIKLIEMRRKNIIHSQPISKQDVDSLVNICMNALK